VVCLGLALHPAPVPVVAAAPFLTGPWAVPSAAALLATAVQAVGSLAGVALITRGYQQAATSVLAVFEYSFLITATLWAWVLWGQTLEPSGYLGIALIVASGALMARASLPARAGNAAQAAFSTGAKRP
jgi:drug/metabolite transporter (DMT)-like permease